MVTTVDDRKHIWIIGQNNKTTEAIEESLCLEHKCNTFPTVESALFNMNSGIRKQPNLIIVADSNSSNEDELKQLISEAKKANIATIIQTTTPSPKTLATVLGTTVVKKDDAGFMGIVRAELKKQELATGKPATNRSK